MVRKVCWPRGGGDGAEASSWVFSTLVPVSSAHLSLFIPVAEGYQTKLAF